MTITLHLPDDIAQYANPGREALERLVIQEYRSEVLTHDQAGQLLGLSRFAFDGFLKAHRLEDHAYGVDDFEQDWAALQRLESNGLLSE